MFGLFQDNGAMDGIQTMGILGALRTGDPKLDMLVAMCLPVILKFVFAKLSVFDDLFDVNAWHTTWMGWWQPQMQHRHITKKTRLNEYGYISDGNDTQNTVLLKAIQLYLDQVVKLRMRDANLELTSIETSVAPNEYNYDEEMYGERDRQDRTIVGMLSKYSIIRKPIHGHWHDLGFFEAKTKNAETVNHVDKKKISQNAVIDKKYMVRLKIDYEETNQGENNKIRHTDLTYHFKSEMGEAIDFFIDKVYQWYLDQLRRLEDNARYFYELKSTALSKSLSNNSDDNDKNSPVFSRYRLSDEKTFQSLFFRQKEPLLRLLNHFSTKTGKYAIKGYPHKVGILLHGPPGSGKTSLIKALAEHTKRSIVNVPLSRIRTNEELQSIFFGKSKTIEGEHVGVKLNFQDVIYVMEDVDAASKVVQRRDGKRTADMVQTNHISIPAHKMAWQLLLESDNDNAKELVTLLKEKSDELSQEAQKPEVVLSIVQKLMSVPGLSLIGEAADDPVLQHVGKDAVQSASDLMNDWDTLDRFVGGRARIILNMIQGNKNNDTVSNVLIKELLSPGLERGAVLRDVSYTRYGAVDTPFITDRAESAFGAMQTENDNGNSSSAEAAAAAIAAMANMNSNNNHKHTANGGSGHKNADNMATNGPTTFSNWSMSPLRDQLNLSGLLNVLDGVVDSPGRIVIMTTNHLEMLDPALIRPGRIDKKLLLGFMQPVDIVLMLEHYFQTKLTPSQNQRVYEVIEGSKHCNTNNGIDKTKNDHFYCPALNLTPAQVEQLTAEYDDVEDMIAALEEKARPAMPRSVPLGATSSKSAISYNV